MTIRQIELFLTLVQTGSFTETSAIHYMTQPAVSQQIQALEKDIGHALFIRNKKNVLLTEAGRALLAEGPSLLSHTQSVYQVIRQSASEKKIVRTLCYIPILRILPELIGRFSETRHDVIINLNQADTMVQNSRLIFERNDITVAFGDPKADYNDLEFISLYSGHFVCLVNRSHHLAEKSAVELSMLKGEVVFSINEGPSDLMLHTVNGIISSVDALQFFPTLSSFYEGVAIAANNCGIAIVPDSGPIWTEYCVSIPLEYPQRYYLGLFIHKNCGQDIREFCSMAVEFCQNDKLPPLIQ